MPFHPRAQKEVLVKGRSVDIINLIEGSLKLQEMWLILEEQTSQPPRNQSETLPSAILFMGRLLFRYKGRRERVLLAIAVHGRVSDIFIIWMCSKHANLSWDAIPAFQTFHLSAAKLRAILKTAPLKNHCLLYWGQPVPCLTSSKFQTCSLLFVVSRHQQYTLSLPHKS